MTPEAEAKLIGRVVGMELALGFVLMRNLTGASNPQAAAAAADNAEAQASALKREAGRHIDEMITPEATAAIMKREADRAIDRCFREAIQYLRVKALSDLDTTPPPSEARN